MKTSASSTFLKNVDSLMKVTVCNMQNEAVGEIELPALIFGIQPRSDILARVVTWQLAKRRQGTHKVKTRSEVSGSTKKMYRQKGTGQARHSTRRVSQFRGGGVVFGPVVRSHAFGLQKKVRALGLKMALSAKVMEHNIIVVDNFSLEAPKTKLAREAFSFLKNETALLMNGDEMPRNMCLATAQLMNLDVLPTIGANVYDILRKDKLILSVSAIEALRERLL